MAELRSNDPALEHDKWLASLAERGIKLSETETEFINSGHSLVPLFEDVLETQATYLQHSATRSLEIASDHGKLDEKITTLTSLYEANAEKARNPQTFRDEDLGTKLSGQARALEIMQTQSLTLENQAAGISANAEEAFPTLRSLIVQMALNDPSFSVEKIPGEVAMNGFETLISNAETLLSDVVTATAPKPVIEIVKAKKDEEETTSPLQPNDNKRLFESWEEVFGDKLPDYEKADKNFIQTYRNAIKRVYETFTERFADCGDITQKGDFDWLKAIEPVLNLTVGELNQATNSDRSNTINTAARIVALAKKWADKDQEFTHHENLVEKTEEIRARGKSDETKLLDLFKPGSEKTSDVHIVVYEDEAETVVEHDEQETADNFVYGALREMYTQIKYQNLSVSFPLQNMTRPKISRYWRPGGKGRELDNGKIINEEFMKKMEKTRLCIPTGPTTGQTHNSYTEIETIKIFVLKLMDADKYNNKKGIAIVLSMIDKGYDGGSSRFQNWVATQNA